MTPRSLHQGLGRLILPFFFFSCYWDTGKEEILAKALQRNRTDSMYVCIHTHTHIYVCIYTHTHMYVYIHTYTHLWC